MKKKTFIAFAICIALTSFAFRSVAQNSLVFSRVVLYDIPSSGTQAITVPSGKIWKIESIGMGASGSIPAVFLKNAANQNIAFFASPFNTSSANYPYWLPTAFTGTLVNNNSSYRCSVSITEYNYTP